MQQPNTLTDLLPWDLWKVVFAHSRLAQATDELAAGEHIRAIVMEEHKIAYLMRDARVHAIWVAPRQREVRKRKRELKRLML